MNCREQSLPAPAAYRSLTCCANLTHAAPRQLLLHRLKRLPLVLYLLHPCSRARLTSRDGGNAGDCREQSLPAPAAYRSFKRRANLTHAAPAHPCARGIPFILNIKKPRPYGRGLKWCIALGIEVWGLPVMRSDTPGTVNLHAKHTPSQVKRM